MDFHEIRPRSIALKQERESVEMPGKSAKSIAVDLMPCFALKERPAMNAELTRHHGVPAMMAVMIGLATAVASASAIGLLAPIIVLQIYVGRHAVLLLRSVWGLGLIAAAVAGFLDVSGMRDVWLSFGAVFALALCIGELLPGRRLDMREADANEAVRIIDSMPAYTWSATSDGRVTHVNTGALHYIGQPPESQSLFHELDGDGWRSAIHPEDYERVLGRAGTPSSPVFRLTRSIGCGGRMASTAGSGRSDDERAAKVPRVGGMAQ
jgi:hypothetical protein